MPIPNYMQYGQATQGIPAVRSAAASRPTAQQWMNGQANQNGYYLLGQFAPQYRNLYSTPGAQTGTPETGSVVRSAAQVGQLGRISSQFFSSPEQVFAAWRDSSRIQGLPFDAQATWNTISAQHANDAHYHDPTYAGPQEGTNYQYPYASEAVKAYHWNESGSPSTGYSYSPSADTGSLIQDMLHPENKPPPVRAEYAGLPSQYASILATRDEAASHPAAYQQWGIPSLGSRGQTVRMG